MVRAKLPMAEKSSPSHARTDPQFSQSQIAELERLQKEAGKEIVRRTARALLRLAGGATFLEAARGTGRGAPWLKNILTVFQRDGVEGLLTRRYRRSCSSSASASHDEDVSVVQVELILD